MRDLKSSKIMALKASLFLILAAACSVEIWLRVPEVSTLLLVLVLAWSAARLYYFLFYVLQTYVDPSLKYCGLFSILLQLAARPRS